MSNLREDNAGNTIPTESQPRRCDDCDRVLENEIELLTGLCDECRPQYSLENGECPRCGNTYLQHRRSLEETDADGRRGRWLCEWYCELCGNEGGYYE